MSVSRIATRLPVANEYAITAPSSRAQLVTVGWFFGLSLALALVAIVAGAPAKVLRTIPHEDQGQTPGG